MPPRSKLLLRPVLLILLAGAPPAARAQDPGPEPFPVRVDRAIDRGVAWLLAAQQDDGSWGPLLAEQDYMGGDEPWNYPAGPTALALLTLCKSGVEPDHPALEKGYAYLREHHRKPMSTYENSMLILALEARHNPHKRGRELERDARRRGRGGALVELPRKDRAWMRLLTEELLARFNDGGWRYGGPPGWLADPHGIKQDMSNTQFAMMALYVAHRCGMRIPAGVAERTIEWTLAQQEAGGPRVERFEPGHDGADGTGETRSAVSDTARGWAYANGSPQRLETLATGTMTTGGIVVLLTARAILEDRAPRSLERLGDRIERSVADGLAWLAHHWTVERNPPPSVGRYHLLYLYGLERVGDLLGRHLIGRHDWYREGAEWLLDHQEDDGRWERVDTNRPKDVLNTCFALLFLDRATMSVVTPRDAGRDR